MEPPSRYQVPPKTRVISLGDVTREFPPGTRIDRYEIVGTLGSGGCGVVYAAKHVHLEQTVALKLLHRNLIHSEERVQRFFREARAAAAVGNQHIVRVSDCGLSEEGVPFLAMEFLKGVVLEELLEDERPLPFERAVDIALQILDGLKAAHEAGVIHRDLKPENIFLVPGPEGEGDFIKIVDFGVSKVFKDSLLSGKQLTGTGALLGTPRYMAPEQFKGAKGVDHRADLFAAAVVLFQMLSGKLPFEGRSPLEIAHRASTEPPKSLAVLAPEVPEAIAEVVYRGLAKEPDERWPSAKSFIAALRDAYERVMVSAESSGVHDSFKTLSGVAFSAKADQLITTIPVAPPLQKEDDGPTYQTGVGPAPLEAAAELEEDEDPTSRTEVPEPGAPRALARGDEAERTFPWGSELGKLAGERDESSTSGLAEAPAVEMASEPSLRVIELPAPVVISAPVVVSEPPQPVLGPHQAPPGAAQEALLRGPVAPQAPDPAERSGPVAVSPVGRRRAWRWLIVIPGALSLVGGLLLGLALVNSDAVGGAGDSSSRPARPEVGFARLEFSGELDRTAFAAVFERARPHLEMCRLPGRDVQVPLEAHVSPPGFSTGRLSMVRPSAASVAPEQTARCCVEAFRLGVTADWNPGESGIATFVINLPAR